MGCAALNLSKALEGVQQIALDTAPLIYFIERHPAYFERMLLIMHSVDQGGMRAVSSTITLAEVLVQPLRAESSDLAKQYEEVLTNSHNFRLEPVTASVARLAASLRGRYALKMPDALHVATAIEAGCDAFLTNDAAIKRVTEITVLILDELELEEPRED